MTLNDLISPNAILPALKVNNKKQAIQEISARAAELTGQNERTILEILMQREKLGSTAVGNGVAIPHGKKLHVKLAGTDSCRASVQILNQGGENNLHYHPNMDLMYMVLKGRVRFYGPGNAVVADCAVHEGVLLPENSRYWFESASDDEELHLLHIETANRRKNQKNRVNLTPKRPGQKPNKRIGYPPGLRHD